MQSLKDPILLWIELMTNWSTVLLLNNIQQVFSLKCKLLNCLSSRDTTLAVKVTPVILACASANMR